MPDGSNSHLLHTKTSSEGSLWQPRQMCLRKEQGQARGKTEATQKCHLRRNGRRHCWQRDILLRGSAPCWSRYTSEETAAHIVSDTEGKFPVHVTKLQICCQTISEIITSPIFEVSSECSTDGFLLSKMLTLIFKAIMNGKARRKKSWISVYFRVHQPSCEPSLFTAKLKGFQVSKGENEGGNKMSFFLENI